MTRLILAFTLLLGGWSDTEMPSDDPGRILAVLKSEVAYLHVKQRVPICLALPEGDPAEDLLTSFANSKLTVRKASECETRHVGTVVRIRRITLSEPKRTNVEVESGRLEIKKGEHFGTLLRRGTYTLTLSPGGKWVVESYSSSFK